MGGASGDRLQFRVPTAGPATAPSGSPSASAQASAAIETRPLVTGLVIGAAASGLAILVGAEGIGGDGWLLLTIACLVASGFAGAFAGGAAAFVGVWLGVAGPWLLLTLTVDSACSVDPGVVCPGAIYFVLAVLSLLFGPLAEGTGFLIGRRVHVTPQGPTGPR